MITVGFKEGSKGLGLGLGYEGETREGEIWNPDITFSNLEERLEKALGAFRKDFKAGISSGNSGPIYGDYGSFLPVYRRQQGVHVREGFSDRMKTKKRSLSLTDRDFISVCKKSKVDDMDPLSVSASAKDQHKYDIHPSKGRKCEASKRSKSSVSGSQNGTVTHSLPSFHGLQKENGTDSLLADGFMGDNSLKTLKQNMNLSEKQNANQSIAAATDALKEAVKLKDYADRIQKSGSISEGRSLSFEAALKAAELCESCAHEYEKSKDMAAAALSYKCMEVAYMRIISSSHAGARKDRHELQRDLKIVPHGKYPSSSGSDVDNLGSPATLDNIVAARNRPIVRLLNFAGDVNSAMEASTKSRIAFAAASRKVEDARFRKGITFVKKALDFSFQDVQGLLWLVRQALEAISR
ncbi:CW-type zinc finger [Actinidia rufa]|uniref:CW-type zinc finger n=1 Tax=Actinidia rufa TaxID=165716 RepID=A0A7J0E5F0_9ERIC|nr:CW-type zinc finger [Actinidia rufa]